MNLQELLQDKTIKAKEKTETISEWIQNKSLSIEELIAVSNSQKDPSKATCIEAMEFATRLNPALGNEEMLAFVTGTLSSKAPRVKWESAKVIGNIAHLFPEKLETPIANLLTNTEFDGTVVRWSAAFALCEILKCKTRHNQDLIPLVEKICSQEEKNSIRKIYQDALKRVK